MSVTIRNHTLPYRPLTGGISIVGQLVGEIGTLGLVMTRDGSDRWVLSNFHVLVGPLSTGTVVGGEEVYQPAFAPAVARLVAGLADGSPDLDCAAARVEPAIRAEGGILGIGTVSDVIQPTRGLRVMKSGAATGVTEGVVDEVNGNLVTIRPLPECGGQYDLSGRGDSGAVWVTRDTVNNQRHAVALHSRSMEGAVEVAFGIAMTAVVARLGLKFLA